MRVGSDEHHLFIVSREAPEVAQFLREQFPADSNVSVLVDRRHGERRRESTTPTDSDRRGPDRRQRGDVAEELRRHTHAFVTVKLA